MSPTSIIPINNNKRDPSGYVYLVKFPYFKNCYKVGFSGTFINRLKTLESLYGRAELISVGYTKDRIRTERAIQAMIYNFSHAKFSYELMKPRLSQDNKIYTLCNNEHEIFNILGPEIQSGRVFFVV